MMMHLHFSEKGKKKFRLIIPLFLVWIILFALLLVMLPFILVASLLAWPSGYGRVILGTIPMLFSVLWALSGLKIHIESRDKLVYLVMK
ncbi:MAG: hypothetical protein JXB23_08610 [Candidatus Aminicenantes bacterium]|nr:hypothetical protein [Candidatus Aminicenantes bacterium]